MTKNFQKTLERRLEKLKRLSKTNYQLYVKWLPEAKTISGEIRGNMILIYDEDELVAISTLYHEFVEYLVVQAAEPYKDLAKKMMELFNEKAYLIKEDTVDGLSNMVHERFE